MRLLKKVVKKIYHLILFLSAFLLFSPRVNATDGATNGSIRSSDIYQSTQAQCYNTNHSSITTDFINNAGYSSYYQCNLNSDRGFLSLNVNHTLVTDTLYQITLYIGNNGNNPIGNPGNFVATGSGVTNANTNNQNGYDRATIWAFNDSWNILSYIQVDNGELTTQPRTSATGMYYITFTVPVDGRAFLNVPLYFGSSTTQVYYYGYNLQVIGRVNGLSRSDVQSAINSSGLATANSVSQVQQSVNQLQTDINTSSQNIIDNQNSNTQQQIESQKVCVERTITNKDIAVTGSLDVNGDIANAYTWGVTNYIKVTKDLKIFSKTGTNASICFYNDSKSLISCLTYGSLSDNSFITIPTNTTYFRASIQKSNNKPNFSYSYCDNGNQALNDSINDLNGNITDSSVDDSSSTLSDLESQLPTNSVISDLLLLPVRLLQSIVNSLSGTCSSFNLGNLYGTNLVMPCIDLPRYLGSTIWTFIDLVFSGMFILIIRKKFIQIWENITNLKGGANEVD